MYNLVLALHIIVSILLVIVILVQRGRGGGLVEALAGAESLFGTKTSSFLVKTTTTLAILFFITSTTLAFLSKQRGLSIFEREKFSEEVTKSQEEPTPKEKEKPHQAREEFEKKPSQDVGEPRQLPKNQ